MQLSAKKTIIFLLLMIGLLFSITGYVFWRIELKHIIKLHQAREGEEARSFQNYLAIINEPQRLLTYDYSYWDDMMEFVASRDASWARENIETALNTFKVDVVWVLDKEFNTIYSVSTGLNGSYESMDIPVEAQNSVAKNWFNHFHVLSPRGLLEISAAPIQPSSDNPRMTPPAGYFITGRSWDETRLRSISELTGREMKIEQRRMAAETDENHLAEIQAGIMVFDVDLYDLNSQSIAKFIVTEKTDIFRQSLASLKREMSRYILFVIFMILMIVFSTIYLIYKPLQKITDSLTNEEPSRLEGLRHQRHEFGALARLVIQSFKHREELSDEIAKQKQSEAARKQLEEQFRQAQKMESVGRLAGGVAHDFNNMLQAISGNIELAMHYAAPGSELSKFLFDAHHSADRAADLTRQLLAFARKQMISPKILNLSETVGSMVKMLGRLLGEEISLTWKPDSDLWLVRIDPSQIDQILVNLCVNARDAIGGVGEVSVELGNVVLDETFRSQHTGSVPGEYVLLTVTDNGSGMTQETLERLYEPFYTTKEVGKGTGLGLATVYGIVKQNEGFIDVESDLGKGSSFTIYFPRCSGEPTETKDKDEQQINAGKNKTVLLVEDEPEILTIVESMLQWLGYKVLATGSPDIALQIATKMTGEIHLLITDVIMPVMNGRELARQIKLIKPDIKCLYVSGHTADVIGEKGVLDEDTNFLQKPFALVNLAAKAREALEG